MGNAVSSFFAEVSDRVRRGWTRVCLRFNRSNRQDQVDEGESPEVYRREPCEFSSVLYLRNLQGESTDEQIVMFVEGDITKQKVDVIVNSTSPSLDLTNGPLAKSILKAVGQKLDFECRSNYPNGISKTDIAITSGGSVCKYVYHTTSSEWENGQGKEQELRHLIQNILQTADKSGMSSIAIPALGTGVLKYPPDVVAKCVCETAKRFSPRSLTKILLVVLGTDREIVKEYKKQMQLDHSGHRSALQVQVVKGDISEQNVDVIVNSTSTELNLSSGPVSKAILKAGGNGLQQECSTNYPNGIQAWDIAETSGGKLKCQAIYHTALKKWVDDPLVEQSFRDVIISCLKRAAESGMRSIAFPVLGAGTLKYPLDVVAKCVFQSFDQYSYNHPNTPLAVARIVIHPDDKTNVQMFVPDGMLYSAEYHSFAENHKGFYVNIPSYWTPMGAQDYVTTIHLDPKDREYSDVVNKFQTEVTGLTAEGVQRVQNQWLYCQYMLHKERKISENPAGTQVERQLWHGTSYPTLSGINNHGFNRSYCGKNATEYGEGTYFAVSARYSAQPMYSPADARGLRHMYLAAVLTGSFTKGKRGMKVPPPKDKAVPDIKYDTLVDDVSNPSMFVVFNDNQAYPLYIVTFK